MNLEDRNEVKIINQIPHKVIQAHNSKMKIQTKSNKGWVLTKIDHIYNYFFNKSPHVQSIHSTIKDIELA